MDRRLLGICWQTVMDVVQMSAFPYLRIDLSQLYFALQ